MLLGLQSGCRRFHFEAFWPKLEGFQEVVAAAWNSVPSPVGGCPFITLDNKFKTLARRLHGWNDKTVGHVTSQLGLAREVLHQLEIANDNRDLTMEENWLKNNLKKHALVLASLKHTIGRLRSRIDWLQDGDTNTKLFFSRKRRRTALHYIKKIKNVV
jgi:hypothetical protein